MIDRTRDEEENGNNEVDRTSRAQRQHRKLGRFRTQERDKADGGQRPTTKHPARRWIDEIPCKPHDRERRAERIRQRTDAEDEPRVADHREEQRQKERQAPRPASRV